MVQKKNAEKLKNCAKKKKNYFLANLCVSVVERPIIEISIAQGKI